MNYKKYDLSQSLNGDKIVHIARNSLGAVIFRESSQEKLKKAIDEHFNNLEEEHKKAEEIKKLAEFEAKKKTSQRAAGKKKLLENKLAEQVAARKAEPEPEPLPEQVEENPKSEKKSFWDRLK